MSNSSADLYVPKPVTEWADKLRADTGHPTSVDRLNVRTWRLTTESDRVRLTMDFISAGRGKIRRHGSTLAVDGAPRDLARDYPHLLAIFKDPDEGRGEPDTPDDMFPPRNPEDAPTTVQMDYRVFVKAGITPEIGEADGQWMIGFRRENSSLLLKYRRRGAGWVMSLQVIVDGVNRSHEADGDINAALALMGGTNPTPAGDKTPRIAGKSASARSNSVETRRATVIRN